MGESLIYMSSSHIVDYVAQHPINWMDDKREMGRIGGAGDRAGLPPVPSVEMWIALLRKNERLFTQAEYTDYCFGDPRWRAWMDGKPTEARDGLRVKLFRNFYPSMIDSLHVWALLAEVGLFDSCIVETDRDALAKIDMTIAVGNRRLALALRGPTPEATWSKDYKQRYRNDGKAANAIELALSIKKPRSPGNKRWFDQEELVTAILCHDLSKGTFEAASDFRRRTGLCPVCRTRPAQRSTCGSARCTSMWTIQYIPRYYWKDALADMLSNTQPKMQANYI